MRVEVERAHRRPTPRRLQPLAADARPPRRFAHRQPRSPRDARRADRAVRSRHRNSGHRQLDAEHILEVAPQLTRPGTAVHAPLLRRHARRAHPPTIRRRLGRLAHETKAWRRRPRRRSHAPRRIVTRRRVRPRRAQVRRRQIGLMDLAEAAGAQEDGNRCRPTAPHRHCIGARATSRRPVRWQRERDGGRQGGGNVADRRRIERGRRAGHRRLALRAHRLYTSGSSHN